MLAARQITLERYFEPVFAAVDLQLQAGELLLISGANGAGKTTLLRLLAGVLRPSSGRVQRAADACIYLGHQLAIKDELSVLENIDFMHAMQGQHSKTPAQTAHELGLAHVASHAARTLSAGQRKRCALARLLPGPGILWLLDEPYANLDPQGIALLDGLLKQHLASGGSCVLASHESLRPQGFEMREYRLQAAPAKA